MSKAIVRNWRKRLQFRDGISPVHVQAKRSYDKMYEARGYRFIEFRQWEIANYLSVVMSKKL